MTALKDRVAIITGGARGMGLAIAERLAPQLGGIVMLDTLDDVHKSAEDVAKIGCRTLPIVCDISDENDVARVMAQVKAEFGRVDMLMNNAGISPKFQGRKAFIEEITVEEWDRVFAVNMRGVFLMARGVIPFMREQKWGRIVNTASAAARSLRSVLPGSHYTASKTAVVGFSRVLAEEVGPYNVTVNCIAPGRILTAMAATTSRPGLNEEYAAGLPLRRLGTPEDIAALVEFLMSDEAGYITGTVVDINGGEFMV